MINRDHESLVISDFPDATVQTLSGRVLGYGYISPDGTLAVFKSTMSGDDEFEGLVSRGGIEFGSGVTSAMVNGDVLYDADGHAIAQIKNDHISSMAGEKYCRVTGRATAQQKAGAGLLLVLNKWMLPDGSPNLEVR